MMKKIFISGLTGSGKSTLARELGELTSYPIYHADTMLIYKSGKQRPKSDQFADLMRIVETEFWILDGALQNSRDFIIANADCFVVVDTPTKQRRWNLLKRGWQCYFANPMKIPHVAVNPWRIKFYIRLFQNHKELYQSINATAKNAAEDLKVYRIQNAADRRKFIDAFIAESQQYETGDDHRWVGVREILARG